MFVYVRAAATLYMFLYVHAMQFLTSASQRRKCNRRASGVAPHPPKTHGARNGQGGRVGG